MADLVSMELRSLRDSAATNSTPAFEIVIKKIIDAETPAAKKQFGGFGIKWFRTIRRPAKIDMQNFVHIAFGQALIFRVHVYCPCPLLGARGRYFDNMLQITQGLSSKNFK